MYLKSIEVVGFKSFANKIDFQFHNGITCIVGPNGSGKSNVADAVRWVLGEQSAKQLRGANMSDVIFSGTEMRKPQGYASVAITLDNSDHRLPIDYEEVTVSRKVFRSGESEYKINGVITRLKDIQELFYDTGIGKEGYSIIGQGQIDRILSNKPEERRELFDEAAGIVKYKRRKKETLKKLENVHANLLRVTDILSELEKQVGPLERQSENAKKFLALRDELKTFDFRLFAKDYEQGEEKLKEIEDNLEIVISNIETQNQANKSLLDEYEEVNTSIDRLDDLIKESSKAARDAQSNAQDKQSRILVINEQINSENIVISHTEERLGKILEEQQRHQKDRESVNQSLSENGAREYELANKEYDSTNILAALDIRIQKHEKNVSEGKNKLLSLLNEKTDAASKLEHFKTLESQQLIKRGEVNARLLKLNTDRSDLEVSLAEKRQDLEDINVLISAQNTEIDSRKKLLSSDLLKLEEAERSFRDAENKGSVAKKNAEHLKGLEERYEGYQNSIKMVMRYGKEKGMNIPGVISDLIKVPKKYEVAIEIALGGSIQNIVTKDTETAKELISYLKRDKLGRATFLPLDSFLKPVQFSKNEALKEKGCLGIASELLECDAKYKNVISHLLARTMVVDSFDNANAIAKKYGFSLRIVTLDGELFSPGGSLTGGAFKNSNNLLGRKREIEELEAAVREAEENKKEASKRIDTYKKKTDDLKNAINELSGQLQDMLIKKKEITVLISQAQERLTSISSDLANAEDDNAGIEKILSSLRQERETMTDSLRSIEEENSDSEKNISEDEAKLADEKSRRDALSNEVSNARIELSKCRQEKEFLLQNLERVEGELSRLADEKEELDKKKKATASSIESLNATIDAFEKEKQAYLEEAKKAGEESEKLSKEREKYSASQKTFFAKQQEISDALREYEMEKLRLEGRKEKLEDHQQSLVDYLWSEWEVSPAEVLNETDASELTLNELKKETARLKNSIKALGSININAIEEYKEVSERYEFMKNQCDDLSASEVTLGGIIEELDTGMRKQFNEQFGRIQTEFNSVFRELFGGGSGKLELVEDEDVIEAGIRIISQPPGKKLQNMMQLSGGEKALTAIALLFAIQNLKPSPFALLDEIEAALDDSNVTRFARYLHKLTSNTQFIVISHRRGTMVSADRLYGITMMEKGVSSLVSVNMVEKDLDA